MNELKLLDEFVDVFLFGNDEMEYVFNRQTKEILLDAPESLTGEPEIDWDDEEAVEFLIMIPQITTAEAYDLMLGFAKTQDSTIAVQLLDVLNGRKPFRSFKDKLSECGIENQWYSFENEYAKNRMKEWLDQHI